MHDENLSNTAIGADQSATLKIIAVLNKHHIYCRINFAAIFGTSINTISLKGRTQEVEKYRKLFIGTLVFAIPAFLVSMVLMYLPYIGELIETPIGTPHCCA